ncbi:S8 family serine peptidase [Saccharothrix violaceirubra]|uniref:Subtilisin family serine protease n=1 Tax=Saccharothrix violaceirubra TaxID=413306 RepID=A0A7W7T654_9PSEU|nr:S8 family peptidase [Saccharothrix violaceirubra]MBB4966717.1 subtilisin family serine protease [Saccharothrix violaceirubra]
MSARFRALAGAALLVCAIPLYGAPPGASAAPGGTPPARTAPAEPGPAEPASPHRVTLITGDVVVYDDNPAAARIEPAPRENGGRLAFTTTTNSRGVSVYPSDAVPLITAGRLDPALFNVTTLAAEGRTDGETPVIPVIAKTDGRPAALAVTTHLTGAVGLRVDKAQAPGFWNALKSDSLGLSKVSLDRKVKPVLDHAAPRSAPAAAPDPDAEGTGVTVAVVDTGIDVGHPDLVGRVAAEADFSGDGDTGDHHGHGTHVASTIAGSGAASGGKYRGVAPGATLLSAKVFDRTGSGDESQVMAGIEWAVAQGAKIVNLSLGAGVTDGTDPLSELVDRLSAEHGTLFVAAAGNSGSGDRTVTTPGAAASALTVGAVDRDDRLAWFSSRGPRLRDALVKPEIVAPGVDVVAARAAGTSMGTPVDDRYTSSSGTSMATPHVAGAAALLAQQHPDWTGGVIKDVLASTAKDVGLKWYEQGAGRLDIPRALTQRMTGPASAGFGRVEGTEPAAHQVVYRNEGGTPQHVDLSLGVQSWDGTPPKPDSMRLTTGSLSLPPGSTAATTVTVDPDAGPAGVYGGTIVVGDAQGGTIRTPVSTYNPPPAQPISVRVLDSTGAPATEALAQVVDDALGEGNRNDPFLDQVEHWVDLVGGVGRVSLPRSTYSVLGWVVENGLTARRWCGLGASELVVDKPTTVTLDCRAAVPVRGDTTVRTDQRDRTVTLRRVLPAPAGGVGNTTEIGLSAGAADWETRVTPAAPTKVGAISLQDYAILGSAAVDLVDAGGRRLDPGYDVGSVTGSLVGGHRFALVPPGGDVKGKAVVVRIAPPTGAADPVGAVDLAMSKAAQTAARAGAAALVAYVDLPGAIAPTPPVGAALPVFTLDQAQGESLRAKGGDVTITVRATPEAMFNLSVVDRNGVPKDRVRRYRPEDLVATRTAYHADQPGLTAGKSWYAFPDGLWKTQFVQGVGITAPGTWTEYTGPGDQRTVWKRVTTLGVPGRAALSINRFNVYKPGERTRPDEFWFRAPLRPGAVELNADHPGRYPSAEGRWRVPCSQCREGDMFTPALQWVDGQGFVSPQENSKYFATTTARLFRDDLEILPVKDPFARFPRFALAPRSARYRLEVTDVMAGAGRIGAPSTLLFGHARRIETTWTFTSSRSDDAPPPGYSCQHGDRCAFQPLIQVDYRLPLDVTNTLSGDTFDLAVASHTGAHDAGPVVWVHVAWSTDGTTWTDVVAKPRGGGVWSVAAPAASGDVSLRVDARDSRGNTVRQTIRGTYRSG